MLSIENYKDAIPLPVESASVDLVIGGFPGQAFSDLVIDGSLNTKVTSAYCPFVAGDVGKILVVTGGTGFTVGTYYIASVADGAATLSAAVGTVASIGGVARFASNFRALLILVAGNVALTTIARPVTKQTMMSVPAGVLPIQTAILYRVANGTAATGIYGLV
jgi:hypothetical protein